MAGIDQMLDAFTSTIKDAEQGVKVLFSATPFPNWKIKLEWRRSEYEGNWYFCEALGFEGWLCPALFKYFDRAPKEIYAEIKAK